MLIKSQHRSSEGVNKFIRMITQKRNRKHFELNFLSY